MGRGTANLARRPCVHGPLACPGRECAGLDDQGDRIALAHLWEKVRPGGRLIVSVPAGRPSVQRGYRGYDERALGVVLPAEGRISFFRMQGRRGTWRPSTGAEIAAVEFENYFAQAPSEGVALAVVRKAQS